MTDIYTITPLDFEQICESQDYRAEGIGLVYYELIYKGRDTYTWEQHYHQEVTHKNYPENNVVYPSFEAVAKYGDAHHVENISPYLTKIGVIDKQ